MSASVVLVDVQARGDLRGIAIDQAGVSGLRYPIVVLDRVNGRQNTIAEISMSVGVPQQFKGTHMSRFLEVLNDCHGDVTMATLPEILSTLATHLEADSARIDVAFPYFLKRSAPASGATGLMDYQCSFRGEIRNGVADFILGVEVPVTSLCPCSKEISDYGAHNQRGIVSMSVRSAGYDKGAPDIIWIEELVEVAERSASAPVYPLLKRSDERHVTMQAYDNPVFVEDMVRNVAKALQSDLRVGWFRVHAVNHESIHNHGAFAEVEWQR